MSIDTWFIIMYYPFVLGSLLLIYFFLIKGKIKIFKK